ncbi:Gtr1/RagA G protein Gtr2 [Flagelloscypha sp. PMI_526]|nr:Gtr1/RagA G protein Gtr2 [Flagelloscypha sp. PMI_526]
MTSTYGATTQTSPTASKPSIERSKVLLLGLRRSGKTSIQQVLFNDLPPKQSFYLEPTMRIAKHNYDTIIPLEIWDCPGNITVDSLGTPLSHFRTLIFIIDIRDLYNQPISKMVEFFTAAYRANPGVNLEVFVHKAERLQEDDKIENFRQIQERVSDQLLDVSPDFEQLPLNFHLTSVYDHSLHKAFSTVIHKLVDSLPYLEDLLNVFTANSQSPKAFLFDVKSRLYVATDLSPVDTATHNLCCDYLQMLTSFGPLYKSERPLTGALPSAPPPSEVVSPAFDGSSSSIQAQPDISSSEPGLEETYPSASTSLLSSGSPGTTLTYHKITPHLALLALLPTSVFEARRGLVEYNVVFFRDGVKQIWEVESEARAGRL